MAIVMTMRWKGVTPEQYDEVKQLVGWERRPALGAIYHVAYFDGAALRCTDVWESAEDFERFVETRLMSAVAQVGITTEPQVEICQAHDTFAPGYTANHMISLLSDEPTPV